MSYCFILLFWALSSHLTQNFFQSHCCGPYWPCMLWPYWPCMLWPWVFLWFPPLSLISLHCALDPWPLASGKYAKLASAAESLLGMPLPGYLKFCFLVPFRNLLTCHSFSDPIWNKDHSGVLFIYDLLSIFDFLIIITVLHSIMRKDNLFCNYCYSM